MSFLILVRHGQSEWNEKGLWTGKTDIPLTDLGKKQAREAGGAISDMHIDHAFTSQLIRAQQTLSEIQSVLKLPDLPVTIDSSLAEKDYGDYTGKNKWEIQKEVGDEEFMKIRRSWDYVLPNGESLENVYDRVVSYYQTSILPLLKDGKNVLITAHGNSLRALAKYIENISDADIPQFEIGVGEVLVYEINPEGEMIHKEKRVQATVKA